MSTRIGKILFLSPSYYTTQGHKSILQVVSQIGLTLHQSGRHILVPCTEEPPFTGRHIRWIAEQLVPDIVLVDFPDQSCRDTLYQLKLRLPDCKFVYLCMMGRPCGEPDFLYDLVLGLEPSACLVDTRPESMDVPFIAINPIVAVDHIQPVGSCRLHQVRGRNVLSLHDSCGQDLPVDGVLWIESGTNDERADMHQYLKSRFGRNLVRSYSLPQPATRFARYWSRIISATGYSTSWELCSLGLVSNTIWFHYQRPLEDVERRLSVIKQCSAETAERCRTGFGIHQLTTILSLLLRMDVEKVVQHMERKDEIYQANKSDHGDGTQESAEPKQPDEVR